MKRLFTSLLLLSLLLPASAQVKPFFFMQFTDPQFGMYPFDGGYKKERRNLERAIAAANRLRPAFIVVTGDMTNKAGDAKQIAAYKSVLAMIDSSIPVYHVPGNHDVGNTPTPDSIASYRAQYGPDHVSFVYNGMLIVGFNTTLMKNPAQAAEASAQQSEWLDSVISVARRNGKPSIIFQHHPWFTDDPKDRNGYFGMPKEARERWLPAFDSAGVKAVFSGHLHYNLQRSHGNVKLVSSGAVGMPLGLDPSGVRIVNVAADGSVQSTYYPLDNLPAKIE